MGMFNGLKAVVAVDAAVDAAAAEVVAEAVAEAAAVAVVAAVVAEERCLADRIGPDRIKKS